MTKEFADLSAALGRLSSSITGNVPQKEAFVDIWGWSFPALSSLQLAERVDDLQNRVDNYSEEQQTETYRDWIKDLPQIIDKFVSSTLPNLNGNAMPVLAALDPIINYIEGRLPPKNWPIEWEKAADAGHLPKRLLARLRGIEARISDLEPRTGNLDAKIRLIEDAHSAAENLPTDMASLREARSQVDVITKEIDRFAISCQTTKDLIEVEFKTLKEQSKEADALMSNIDSAYRASTSKALADAFAKRSFWLQAQTWIWVLLLIIALISAGYLGLRRVSMLERVLVTESDVSAMLIWLNVALSFLSIAAPVWFAWVATKQISQRFKLAEDYGFKASVAKAYEGYRREAASLDPVFQSRLFGSALARLEEAPLRLMDEENYGSPFHELTSTAGFREALGIVPALKHSYQAVLESLARRTRSNETVEAAAPSTSPL